jgi:hypothetical protein
MNKMNRTPAMRQIQHPGAATQPRVAVVPAALQAVPLQLAPGVSLLAAVASAVAAQGARSAMLQLQEIGRAHV